jgi:TctA family transporter
MFEQSLRQSIEMTGTPTIFLTRPIPLCLIVAALIVVGVTSYLKRRSVEVATLITQSTNET